MTRRFYFLAWRVALALRLARIPTYRIVHGVPPLSGSPASGRVAVRVERTSAWRVGPTRTIAIVDAVTGKAAASLGRMQALADLTAWCQRRGVAP